jgi:transglycosylase-like protein with SLT domain
MSLTPRQRQTARMLVDLARSRGLSRNRALEFAAAAYAESGLDPQATNKSSRAAGLFQLLSSGYRQKAQQLGGLYDPRANALAILPNYVSYWKSHPQAAPGEAGRDVELSGEGADFYSRPLGLLGNLGPAVPAGPGLPPARTLAGGVPPPQPPPQRWRATPEVLGAINQGLEILSKRSPSAMGAEAFAQSKLAQPALGQLPAFVPHRFSAIVPPRPAVASSRTAPIVATKPAGKGYSGALAEAFYDPLGSWDNGHFGGAIGHHSDHVHLSITNPQAMLTAITQARKMGLNVGENPYVGGVEPVHVHGSFHYQDFPGKYGGRKLGKAIDVSGDPVKMAAFYKWATGNLR